MSEPEYEVSRFDGMRFPVQKPEPKLKETATTREAKLAELLRAAMAALETIERATVDEYGGCKISRTCDNCPLNASAPNNRCEWVRAQEARAVLEEESRND